MDTVSDPPLHLSYRCILGSHGEALAVSPLLKIHDFLQVQLSHIQFCQSTIFWTVIFAHLSDFLSTSLLPAFSPLLITGHPRWPGVPPYLTPSGLLFNLFISIFGIQPTCRCRCCLCPSFDILIEVQKPIFIDWKFGAINRNCRAPQILGRKGGDTKQELI